MNLPLWQPSPERIAQANLTAFYAAVNSRWGMQISDYDALYQWSVENTDAFWQSVWQFCGVIASEQGDTVLTSGQHMAEARWFPEARLNFAENLLRRRNHDPALIFWSENGAKRRISTQQLYDTVSQVAQALTAIGVKTGDRVAAYLPNLPETVIAMLASASIGAVWCSCSPDFGTQGVLDRFGQIEPTVLFVTDGYVYNNKVHDVQATIATLLPQLPSVQHTVIVPYAQLPLTLTGAVSTWDAFCAPYPPAPIAFAQLPFNHPLYILFSSGTTGVPKCIVHGAGGTLLQHLKEHQLQTDIKPNDKLFYFTTCGWMMWNWLVSALASEACLLLYDGSPFYPDGNVLWDYAQAEQANVFGTSAKYLDALAKHDYYPAETHDLSALNALLSTGSPLLPESFDYVYQHIKADLQLSSISGGTDIVSCFALGAPVLPVWQGELQCRGLGMAVQVFNENGVPVQGEKGELVCVKPFPSMPIYFWRDPEQRLYQSAYFSRFPNIWCHGDYVELTAHQGLIFYGRSDAVLNPGGVRIGTAEIYRQVEQFPEVLESIVIGQQWQGDVRVVLFVRLREGEYLNDALCQRIKHYIRQQTTPRHVPAKIIQVMDIPRTKSGKIVELAVRQVVHGESVKNQEALANPDALAQYAHLPALQN